MIIASNIVDGYRSRGRAKDWVEWEQAHPGLSESLAWATLEYEKMTNG